MMRDLLTLSVGLVALAVVVVSLAGWVVTVLQVAAVPEASWRHARDDQRTWLLVVLFGGPVAALVFWLVAWPRLSGSDVGMPVLPTRLLEALSEAGRGQHQQRTDDVSRAGQGRGAEQGRGAAVSPSEEPVKQAAPARKTAAKKAPAKKAPAKKAPASKAPARKAPATKATAKKAPARRAPDPEA